MKNTITRISATRCISNNKKELNLAQQHCIESWLIHVSLTIGYKPVFLKNIFILYQVNIYIYIYIYIYIKRERERERERVRERERERERGKLKKQVIQKFWIYNEGMLTIKFFGFDKVSLGF